MTKNRQRRRPFMTVGKTVSFRFAPLSCLIAVAGCQSATPPGQVAVSGDGFEITLAELDQMLKATPPVTRRQDIAPARAAVLNNLIDEKLLAQAASENKLDRDTGVIQEIEAAKRSILAKAYIRKLVGEPKPASANDVQRYYDDHPALFALRRRVMVQDIAIPASHPELRQIQTRFDAIGFDAYAAEARKRDEALEIETRLLPTQTLPADRAAILSRLGPGENISFKVGDQVHLAKIISNEPDPVPLNAPTQAAIGQQLFVSKTSPIIQGAVAEMRKSRHIAIVRKALQEGTQ